MPVLNFLARCGVHGASTPRLRAVARGNHVCNQLCVCTCVAEPNAMNAAAATLPSAAAQAAGVWKPAVHTPSGRRYWWNTATRETQWDNGGSSGSAATTPPAKSAGPVSHVATATAATQPQADQGPWKAFTAPNGRTFYHNAATGVRTWSLPVDASPASARKADSASPSVSVRTSTIGGGAGAGTDSGNASAATSTAAWREAKAPDGRVFYWNPATRERSWTKPTSASPAAAKASAERNAGRGHDAAPAEGWNVATLRDGRKYYWNRDTGERRWKLPAVAGASHWKEAVADNGRAFLYNTSTGQRRWKDPSDGTAQSRSATSVASGTDALGPGVGGAAGTQAPSTAQQRSFGSTVVAAQARAATPDHPLTTTRGEHAVDTRRAGLHVRIGPAADSAGAGAHNARDRWNTAARKWKRLVAPDGRPYWADDTGTTTWTEPGTTTESPPQGDESYWFPTLSQDRKTYYVNVQTRETTWTLPDNVVVVEAVDDPSRSTPGTPIAPFVGDLPGDPISSRRPSFIAKRGKKVRTLSEVELASMIEDLMELHRASTHSTSPNRRQSTGSVHTPGLAGVAEVEPGSEGAAHHASEHPWTVLRDAASRGLYFYCSATGASEWVLPSDVDASRLELSSQQQLLRTSAGVEYVYDEVLETTAWLRAEGGEEAHATESAGSAPEVESAALAWSQYKDTSGRPFYYNRVTGESVWEAPLDFIANPAVKCVAGVAVACCFVLTTLVPCLRQRHAVGRNHLPTHSTLHRDSQ